MPMRVGFVQHRMRLLQEELENVLSMLPQLGVKKAVLLNPLYPGTIAPDTALKIVMIMEDDRPFVRRPDFFYSHILPSAAVDFFPYTPQEIDDICKTDSYLSKALRRGEVIYDA